MTPLAPLADRFAFDDGFLDQLTGDFTEDDWLARTGETNHAQWLLGHLASARRFILRLLEQPADEQDWEKHFGAGCRPSAESEALTPATLREEFRAAGEQLVAALRQAPAELAGKAVDRFPDGSATVGGAVHFLHFHEAYHLGQLGLIRRTRGRPGLV
jgi:hypothetical protein